MTAAVFAEITQAQVLPQLVRLGPNLYGAVFTLMKLVPARHILLAAERSGELGPDTMIVETTSGTFGLALAMQAALLRRPLTLVSDPAIDVNLHRRLTDLGARVEICAEPLPIGGYQEARLVRLAEIRERHADTFCPEQYSNPLNPASYHVVAEHLTDVLGDIDCVVGAVGSGGSMCGTVNALRAYRPDVTAIGVDTHRSVLFGQPDGKRLLRGLGNSLMPANLDHTVFDEVHWCTAAEAFAATRELHRTRALFQGPTSGAAYLAARWWAARNPDATCVVLLADSGYRYLETVYNDAWLVGKGMLATSLPAEPEEATDPGTPGTAWRRFRWARRDYEQVVGRAAPRRPAEVGATR